MNKATCVLLLDTFKHLLFMAFPKLVGKVNFLERELEEMH